MIIGVNGFIGSGKDTVSDYLQQKYGFEHVSFADTLKQAVSAVFGWPMDMLEGKTKESREWREQIDSWWSQRLGMPELSPRWVLQQWGTNLCRRNFHPDIWVASLEKHLTNTDHNIVISDCRFVNEIAAIRNQGGKLIRVNRGPLPEWYDTATKEINYRQQAIDGIQVDELMQVKFPDIHISEWGWILEKFDYTIENNDTLDSLYRQVDDVVLELFK